MCDVFCVTKRKLCREDFLTRVERIVSCHPAGIILREKDMSEEAYTELASAVMEICNRHGVKCILHTFADVAISLHCDALHVPLALLREMPSDKRQNFAVLGASCHSIEEALEAQALGCTYITAGHVFETDCKKGLHKPEKRTYAFPVHLRYCVNSVKGGLRLLAFRNQDSGILPKQRIQLH